MTHLSNGQRGAIMGLLLAGLSTQKISFILGVDVQRVRKMVPPDWMPPRYGTTKRGNRGKATKRRADKEAIVAHYKSGHHTLQETGDVFGVTREYVRLVLVSRGICERTFRSFPKEVQEERLRRYQAALQPGVSTKEAVEASGISYHEAWHAARALGVSLPKPVRKGRVRYAEIAAFYEANTHLTGKAVAEHFRVSPMTVSKCLRVMGVTPRHSGWTHAHHSAPAQVSA